MFEDKKGRKSRKNLHPLNGDSSNAKSSKNHENILDEYEDYYSYLDDNPNNQYYETTSDDFKYDYPESNEKTDNDSTENITKNKEDDSDKNKNHIIPKKTLKNEEILRKNIVFTQDTVDNVISILEEEDKKTRSIDPNISNTTIYKQTPKKPSSNYLNNKTKDKDNSSKIDLIDFDFDKDSSQSNTTAGVIDLRIIVNNSKNAECLNKATENIQLNDYNIVVSAIIQTFDLETAKSTTDGADIIFIANEADKDGQLLYYQLYDHLKTEGNYIDFLQIPSAKTEKDLIKELNYNIRKLIVNIGLNSIFNCTDFNKLKGKIKKLEQAYVEFLNENATLDKDNSNLQKKINELNEDITNYQSEINDLKNANDDLKKDNDDLKNANNDLNEEFEEYKSTSSNIPNNGGIMTFPLKDLWYEIFDEEMKVDMIILATNQIKPKGIIVGQGLIGAKDLNHAVDWLKIVRTAIIYAEQTKNNSKNKNVHDKNDLDKYYSDKIASDNNESDKKDLDNIDTKK